MTEETQVVETSVGSETGVVEWFNQRKGYGFIKIVNPESSLYETSIFTHFSSIMSKNNYKKIFPGEYVSLNVVKDSKDETRYNAENVRGLFGKDLLIDNEQHMYKVIRKIRNEDRGDNQ